MKNKISDIKKILDRDIDKGLLQPASEQTERAAARMNSLISARLKEECAKLASYAVRLENLSPLTLLAKGYTICEDTSGTVIRSAASVKQGDKLKIRMNDGEVRTLVERTELFELAEGVK